MCYDYSRTNDFLKAYLGAYELGEKYKAIEEANEGFKDHLRKCVRGIKQKGVQCKEYPHTTIVSINTVRENGIILSAEYYDIFHQCEILEKLIETLPIEKLRAKLDEIIRTNTDRTTRFNPIVIALLSGFIIPSVCKRCGIDIPYYKKRVVGLCAKCEEEVRLL
ncbi:MAG: hypothetical protein AMQ74_01941 [Candidatus Methanofastidiosum methylothiophilum]|uniref:Uncharacterized protein n=1 Tax=Candidatus Methanofastidiosum methylothiophilum TaxID=1705564 RepID=A0A150IIA1_9EURY|nr:MAG: hypothetical protein AMQ74_01941 [Candidatus Methanofastidiosum methylthiophilus]